MLLIFWNLNVHFLSLLMLQLKKIDLAYLPSLIKRQGKFEHDTIEWKKIQMLIFILEAQRELGILKKDGLLEKRQLPSKDKKLKNERKLLRAKKIIAAKHKCSKIGLARMLRVSPSLVHKWITICNTSGIDVLLHVSNRKNKTISKEVLDKLDFYMRRSQRKYSFNEICDFINKELKSQGKLKTEVQYSNLIKYVKKNLHAQFETYKKEKVRINDEVEKKLLFYLKDSEYVYSIRKICDEINKELRTSIHHTTILAYLKKDLHNEYNIFKSLKKGKREAFIKIVKRPGLFDNVGKIFPH